MLFLLLPAKIYRIISRMAHHILLPSPGISYLSYAPLCHNKQPEEKGHVTLNFPSPEVLCTVSCIGLILNK